jgi:hypothetical protein
VLIGISAGLNGLQPVHLWKAPAYLAVGLTVSGLLLACVSFGNWLLSRGLHVRLPATEHLLMALSVGVLAFGQ